MVDLGVFGIDEYVTFPVQANNADGSAADLDSGSFTINFYESDPAAADAPAAMTTPDTTFNTKLDTKTGLYYGKVQMTALNGFEAGKQYFARVTGTVDTQTPATLFHWLVVTSSRKTVYDTVTTNLDATVGSRSTFSASEEVDIGAVKGVAVSGVDDFKADVTNLDAAVSTRSTFDASSDEVDIGSVKGVAVAGVDDFKADVSGLSTLTAANVNAEVSDVIKTDANTAVTSIPSKNATLAQKIDFIFQFIKNKKVQTSDTFTLYDDDGVALSSGTVTDVSSTLTKNKLADA